MPESRDRLSRQDSIVASYSQRRISRTGDRNRGISIAFVLEDDNEEVQAARTPFRWRDAALAGNPGSIGLAARDAIGTPSIWPSQNLSTVVGSGRSRGGAFGTPRIRRIAPLVGPENLSLVVGSGQGRGRGVTLPIWYPRRPLNDITAVVWAIERRRERGGDGEGLQTESPLPQDRTSHDQVTTPSAHIENKLTMISPHPMFSNRRFPPSIGKVSKILLDITHHNNGDAVCLTPQKKLLHSIDTVEKVVMEELRKLKRTPSAKKAEREKRVRKLMSMR